MTEYELKGYVIDGMFKERAKPRVERDQRKEYVCFIAGRVEFEYDGHSVPFQVIKWMVDRQFLKLHGYLLQGNEMMFRYGINEERYSKLTEE